MWITQASLWMYCLGLFICIEIINKLKDTHTHTNNKLYPPKEEKEKSKTSFQGFNKWKINHEGVSLSGISSGDPPSGRSSGSGTVMMWSFRGLFLVSGRHSIRKPQSKARPPNTGKGRTSRDPLLYNKSQ